jgi:hypothetical protein
MSDWRSWVKALVFGVAVCAAFLLAMHLWPPGHG